MNERISYQAEEEAWRRADADMRSRHTPAYYQAFRHRLMPDKLSLRAANMVKGIIAQTHLLRSVSRRQGSAPDWLHAGSGVLWTRKSLRKRICVLRQYIRQRGGRQGEFAPIIRSFVLGWSDNVDFEKDITWALRLLERAADEREATEEGGESGQRDETA